MRIHQTDIAPMRYETAHKAMTRKPIVTVASERIRSHSAEAPF